METKGVGIPLVEILYRSLVWALKSPGLQKSCLNPGLKALNLPQWPGDHL